MKVNQFGVMNLEEKVLYSFSSLYFYDAGQRQGVRISDHAGVLYQ